ncbi:MAG: Na+/H+ antiporter NhaC family protein [Coriobacteriales bacterium]
MKIKQKHIVQVPEETPKKAVPTANARALLPIVVFLVLYLGCGIYFEYVSPIQGQMGFYVVSVVVAFVIALVVAFFQNRSLSFDDKIHVCAKGIGDDNIVIMLFIFLMAGAFSGIASEAGGASSTANLLLDILPAQAAIPGLFVIACVISLAMGTSVGTITVLTPIAVTVANSAGFNLPLCVATVVGGAMFGDNLSFISDTTIASTRTQGVGMKAKFYANFRIVVPAAIITLGVLIVLAVMAGTPSLDHYDYNIWQALPYFVVLVAALAGVNVFLVLGGGIVLFAIVGVATGSLDFASAFISMGNGTAGMYETMIVTLLVASISALIRAYGGFAAILRFVEKHFKGVRGGELGCGLLTLLLDIACANNTVAIVVAGPIAKQIGDEYGVKPARVASLIDTFACVGQGLIPYGAQLLVAAGLANVESVAIMPFLFYQFLLLVCVLISIAFSSRKGRNV